MIPRYQRWLFGVLLAVTCAMGGCLLYLRRTAHDRMRANPDAAPIATGTTGPQQPVTLILPDDTSGKLHRVDATVAATATPGAEARGLVVLLLANCAQSGSRHPLPKGVAVTDIFLMDSRKRLPAAFNMSPTPQKTPVMAVINLTRGFVEHHPSGIAVEDLTIRAIAATLHENLPQIKQVRFLVDGQTRDTLAGHADLTRAYSTIPDEDDPVEGAIQ